MQLELSEERNMPIAQVVQFFACLEQVLQLESQGMHRRYPISSVQKKPSPQLLQLPFETEKKCILQLMHLELDSKQPSQPMSQGYTLLSVVLRKVPYFTSTHWSASALK